MSDYEAIYGADNALFEDKPHGWIQWKGTKVCIDLHCVCGAHGHVDAKFFYHYECAACHRKYALGLNVPLIELTPEQAAGIAENGCAFITDTSVLDDEDSQSDGRAEHE